MYVCDISLLALQDMKKTEDEHLAVMNELVVDRRVRPTLLLPFWDIAEFALGAATGLMGKQAAEEVISDYYNDQIRSLLDAEDELKEVLKKHRG